MVTVRLSALTFRTRARMRFKPTESTICTDFKSSLSPLHASVPCSFKIPLIAAPMRFTLVLTIFPRTLTESDPEVLLNLGVTMVSRPSTGSKVKFENERDSLLLHTHLITQFVHQPSPRWEPSSTSRSAIRASGSNLCPWSASSTLTRKIHGFPQPRGFNRFLEIIGGATPQ